MGNFRRAPDTLALPALDRNGKPNGLARRLTPRGRALIDLMVHSKKPIGINEACLQMGLSIDDGLTVMRLKHFSEELKKQLAARRQLEQAQNLALAIELRDAPGDGSPKAALIRLKAARLIDQAYNEALRQARAPGAQIQINNIQEGSSAAKDRPGYILDLTRPATKQIEHEPSAVPNGNPWATKAEPN